MNNMNEIKTEISITPQQLEEMRRVKSYFPYRVVWMGFINGDFVGPYAESTKRGANAIVRKGGLAWTI
jgi:hypothetical protein